MLFDDFQWFLVCSSLIPGFPETQGPGKYQKKEIERVRNDKSTKQEQIDRTQVFNLKLG